MRKKNQNMISALMDSTVKIIARDGFDKASIRSISGDCDLPNAYIYVHFKDKYDLYAKAFQREDEALACEISKNMSILKKTGIINENRLYCLFSGVWMHLISYPDSCRFYIQYYYSPLYQKYSAQEHSNLWTPIVENLKVLFRPEIDVKAALRSVLNTMIHQAIETVSDLSANMESAVQNNYRLISGMVRSGLMEE